MISLHFASINQGHAALSPTKAPNIAPKIMAKAIVQSVTSARSSDQGSGFFGSLVTVQLPFLCGYRELRMYEFPNDGCIFSKLPLSVRGASLVE